MTLSSARQRNAVSQGVALGMLLCGRAELPRDKVRIDLAFAAAWRDWEYRDRFSQVNTDLRKGLDPVHAITRADESKQVVGVHWVHAGFDWTITVRDPDWSIDRPDDVERALKMIDGDVPLDGWTSLAEDFLERLMR